jgi:Fe2+ or Zn2+ uptake regulation protein
VLKRCDLKTLQREVKRMGFANIRHRLEFFGLCVVCQKRRSLRS